jgi:cytochrome c peroxidase
MRMAPPCKVPSRFNKSQLNPMKTLHFCAEPTRLRAFFILFLSMSMAGLTACDGSSQTTFELDTNSSFDWGLSANTPLPIEPDNNPMTEAKFQLGRHLFYDETLSGNGTQSCSSCHLQALGFADGETLPLGSTGQTLARNAQALLNVGYNATFTWANSSLLALESQIAIPLFGEDPIEHGINDSNEDLVLDDLRAHPIYPDMFEAAFPDDGDPVDMNNVIRSLATFIRGMVSFETDFDRFQKGDDNALSAAAKRGQTLFFSEELDCFHCHGGYNFSNSTVDRTIHPAFIERPFHNTGLFNIGGTGDYPADNTGIFELTAVPSHMGKFRAPTLRNIAVTAPYMHDGSIASLEEVIDFYAAAGRNITVGPNAGDGRSNPFKDSLVDGFSITPSEKQDLIAFLNALTDHSFNSNPRFSQPTE